jgi:hypothetical protein
MALMTTGPRRRWDPIAAIAALIAVIMIGVYAAVLSRQDDQPVVWFAAGLLAATLLAAYGAARAAPRRRTALSVSGSMMVALGILGLLSIGLPILGAGLLALIAAARATT